MTFVLQSKKPNTVPNNVEKRAMEKAMMPLLAKRRNVSLSNNCKLAPNKPSTKRAVPSVYRTGVTTKKINDKYIIV